jgi:hypothetical protein
VDIILRFEGGFFALLLIERSLLKQNKMKLYLDGDKIPGPGEEIVEYSVHTE